MDQRFGSLRDAAANPVTPPSLQTAGATSMRSPPCAGPQPMGPLPPRDTRPPTGRPGADETSTDHAGGLRRAGERLLPHATEVHHAARRGQRALSNQLPPMTSPLTPTLRFLSLFVPDLADATRRYSELFGVEPRRVDTQAPHVHPFAAGGPVVFELGGVELALYQCDGRTTHPGDVGIGISTPGSTEPLARRAGELGGRVFFGPKPLPGDGRDGAFFVLPDRHFFELLGAPVK
jgi:hypothetical protein